MIQIAIVEDEDCEAAKLSESLERFAQEHDDAFSIRRFRNGLEFLSADYVACDLVFLDVEMPILDGIETAKRLRERDSKVVLVFITKLFQYAVNGYEYDAADFIIKPLRYPSFSLKMEKLMKKFRQAEGKHISLPFQLAEVASPVAFVTRIVTPKYVDTARFFENR